MELKMQSYLAQMLGKTVKAVLVKQCEQGSLREQVFLLFDDETFFEFYSRDGAIEAAKGLKSGSLDELRDYMGPECPNVVGGHPVGGTVSINRELTDVSRYLS